MSKDVDKLLWEPMRELRRAIVDCQITLGAQKFVQIYDFLTVLEINLDHFLKKSEPKKPRLLAWRMNDPTCTEFGYISLFEENPFAPSSDLPLWERCPWLDEPEEE